MLEEAVEKNIAHTARRGQCSVTMDKNDQPGIHGFIIGVTVNGGADVTYKWIDDV